MISTKLIELLILERSIRLDEILIKLSLFYRDNEGRILPNVANSDKSFLKELDRFVYTLEFLLKEDMLEIVNSSGLVGLSFHRFIFQSTSTSQEASHVLFLEKILERDLGKTYQIKLSIFQYKENHYRTLSEKSSHDNFVTALSAAIVSSGLTALLTVLFSKWLSQPNVQKIVDQNSFSGNTEYSFLYIVPFVVFAITLSSYIGIKCFKIHNIDQGQYTPSSKKVQHLFNFFGALIGWMALYYLLFTDFSWRVEDFQLKHLVLIITAYLGVFGYLPYFLTRFKS